jgi:LPXTG-motif cell wall-anchored protein
MTARNDGASASLPKVSHHPFLAALAAIVLVVGALMHTSVSGAATAPLLGTADGFAVVASSTVTNTGPSVLDGDLGVSPGTAVTGFTTSDPPGPGLVNGEIYAGEEVAARALADASDAYDSLDTQACDEDLTGQDLGDKTLTPGVYCFSSSAQLTGALTLDAVGDPAAVFIFKIASTLTTASSSQVVLTEPAQACNVFWRVGSSATLGTDTSFAGTVLAGASVTANTRASVLGRLIALSAAVTLDTNLITAGACTTDGTTDGTTDETDGTTAGTDGTTDGTDGTTDGTDETTDGTTDGTGETTDGTGETTDGTDETTDGTDETTGGPDVPGGPVETTPPGPSDTLPEIPSPTTPDSTPDRPAVTTPDSPEPTDDAGRVTGSGGRDTGFGIGAPGARSGGTSGDGSTTHLPRTGSSAMTLALLGALASALGGLALHVARVRARADTI